MNNSETRLERLSWPEVAAAIAAGKTTAMIVAASSEWRPQQMQRFATAASATQ